MTLTDGGFNQPLGSGKIRGSDQDTPHAIRGLFGVSSVPSATKLFNVGDNTVGQMAALTVKSDSKFQYSIRSADADHNSTLLRMCPYYLEAKHRTGNFRMIIIGISLSMVRMWMITPSFSGTGTAFNLPADPRMVIGQTNTRADVFEAFFYDGALNYSFDRDVYLKKEVGTSGR